ncbi:DUF2272 domain-containing protein [Piscirickettsia salmonis]|uniref:DUF2272 domain-containing protein n=1 Tax=Piscirickettsia salmonis TaxID=1238 RepID=UPI0007C8EAC1|nr:hypothetical protein A0O36_01089 [Piscirickettsiaceae bacterium NZ-RLO1]
MNQGIFISRLLAYLHSEHQFFGGQTYDKDDNAVQEGYQEYEPAQSNRIGEYWNFLGHDLNGKDRDWPWSAAFISFMLQLSGAEKFFRGSIRHADYMNQAIRDRDNSMALYNGFKVNEKEVKVGDLLGYGRAGAGVSYDNALATGRYTSHCDIVTSVTDQEIIVIGGNVGDSVTARPYILSNGKLDESRRPWITHMSLNHVISEMIY